MKLTHQLLQAGRTDAGGFNRHQLECLGVPWPPIKGWPARIIGTDISDEKYQEYIRLGKMPASARRASAKAAPDDGENVSLLIPKRYVEVVLLLIATIEKESEALCSTPRALR